MVLHPRNQSVGSNTGGKSVPTGIVDPDSATLQLGRTAAPASFPHEVTFDNAQATWDVLARHLESFLTAWEQSPLPPIAEHLPAGPPVLRRLALVELIKVDIEQRFAAGQGRVLEDYAREFPEIADETGPPCELIYEEFHVRNRHGFALTPADYFARFPGRKVELAKLLGVERTVASAVSYDARRPRDYQVGDQIDDFDLLLKLGSGAFATVYLARQRSINRLVALKISADRGVEARTLAFLDHPNIVRVFDERRLPDQKLRLVYMQYASGGTLADVIERVRQIPLRERSGKYLVEVVHEAGERAGLGPLGDPSLLAATAQLSWPEVVCRIGGSLARALDHAHRNGVLHRDVKPANILLAGDGSPKLADFNISANSTHPSVGAAAYFGGSLAYMSPEHLEAFNPRHERTAEELDHRADLYSLAVVLWELLTGEKPFRDLKIDEDWAQTLAAMTQRRQQCELVAAPDRQHENLCNLYEVLERALSADPADRPQSGAEFAHELSICAQDKTRRLVRLNNRGWREWVRRFPVIAVLVVVTVPNIIASVFNIVYNWFAIVKGNAIASHVFWDIMPIINGVAFSVGAVLVVRFVWPVAWLVKRSHNLRLLDPQMLHQRRRQALQLGNWAALLGVLEWTIAGILWPTALALSDDQMNVSDYPHFVISLILCGLAAAAYPFLGVTFIAVRVLLPALLTRGAVDPALEEDLRRVGRQAGIYFLVACGVPLVGLSLLLMTGAHNTLEHASFILGTLALTSLAGLAFAFKTYSVILHDIDTMVQALRPSDAFGIESTTARK